MYKIIKNILASWNKCMIIKIVINTIHEIHFILDIFIAAIADKALFSFFSLTWITKIT